MSKVARNVFLLVFAIVAAYGAGTASGIFFYPRFFADHESAAEDHGGHDQDDHDKHDHAEEDDGTLALTKQAFDNLELKLGQATLGEYWSSRTVPGEIIEIPGKSDLSVSAPVDGVVEDVFIRAGQSLGLNDRLVTVRITDENLITLQSKLLATISRQEVVRREIARLAPLIAAETVSGKANRELEYELVQLESDRATRIQEIRARGLPEADLQAVIREKALASRLTIIVPPLSAESSNAIASQTAYVSATRRVSDYSVESLQVHPGKSIQRGDRLCNLSYHAELYIRGHAFDDDLVALHEIAANGWGIKADFGHDHRDSHAHTIQREGLRLLYVDNQVDTATQTFNFYLPLINETAQTITDDEGRIFQQWKFKPGQRVHLRLPVEHWLDKITLPIDAVVLEGPNAFVFVEKIRKWYERKEHSHAPGETHDHAARSEEAFIEVEPVPVRLLHKDNRVAVIKNDGQIPLDKRIVLNKAYNLHLAIKTKASGGGGHHGHDH